MNELVKVILKLTISGSSFFLIFSLAAYFMRKVLSAKWSFLLLKINMIFFLIPIVLIYDKLPKATKGIDITSFNSVVSSLENSNHFEEITPYLFWVWVIGAMISAIWNLYCYRRFVKSIKRTSYSDKILEEVVYKCKADLNIFESIKLKRSYLINSPMILGLVKPVIIFPSNMEWTEAKLIPVIIHELIHYKRKDLLFKFLQVFISIIHWFNPIIYMMNNLFEKSCEISCDEIVVENMSYDKRKEYGETILSILDRVSDAPNFLCFYLCNDKKYIRRRLTRMVNAKKANKLNKVFGGLLVCGIIFVSTGVSVAATTDKDNSENIKMQINDESIRGFLKVKAEELKNSVNTSEASKGSIIVVNPETGEVLGTCSYDGK